MSCGHLTTTYETQNFKYIVSDQIRSVTQSCPTLCDSMNRSTPGLPVHHQLPEFTQTHVHQVSDAIQPSHPLSSPSPPVPNPSQHQSLFQCQLFTWGGQSTGVSALASFLPKKSHHRLDGHEFEWTPGDGDGQEGVACCDSWDRKESDMTERLNWTE